MLEARAGFHGNALKSWGETQLPKPWMAVELLGRAVVFGVNGQSLLLEQKARSEWSE